MSAPVSHSANDPAGARQVFKPYNNPFAKTHKPFSEGTLMGRNVTVYNPSLGPVTLTLPSSNRMLIKNLDGKIYISNRDLSGRYMGSDNSELK